MSSLLQYESGSPSEATSSSMEGDDDNSSELSSVPSLPNIPIPDKVTSNITTFGYQQALANRVFETALTKGGEFDHAVSMPVFVHDSLMLPGSLGSVLDDDKKQCRAMQHQMTPAFLPGFSARVDKQSLQPRIIRSQESQKYVQGMAVFGLTKADRTLLQNHYRDNAKRKKVYLEIEVFEAYDQPYSPNSMRVARPREKRIQIQAYAFLWRDGKKPDAMEQLLPDRKWNVEDYLQGKLGNKQTLLRISKDGKGDEDDDGFIGREVVEKEIKKEKREEVRGGAGGGDWERSSTFTGW